MSHGSSDNISWTSSTVAEQSLDPPVILSIPRFGYEMRCQHEILLRGNDNEMVQAELEQPSQSGTRQARDIQQNSGKPEDMQITAGKLPSSSSVTRSVLFVPRLREATIFEWAYLAIPRQGCVMFLCSAPLASHQGFSGPYEVTWSYAFPIARRRLVGDHS